MWGSFRAESLKLRKRPAVWVLALLILVIELGIGYAFPYRQYRTAMERTLVFGIVAAEELLSVLPGEFIPRLFARLPGVGGALALVLGAVVAGSEYSWETLKTVLTRRPSRVAVFGGKALALAGVVTMIVLLVVAASATTTALIARRETLEAQHPFVPFITLQLHQRSPQLPDEELAQQANDLAARLPPALQWPSVLDLAMAVGAVWLILVMHAALGLFLGTLARGAALAIGIGLVWLWVIEGLIAAQVARANTVVRSIVASLPGQNADVLSVSLTPGAATTAPVSAAQAVLMLSVYTAVFLVLGALLLRSRDVA
jgi:ABC-type transport system involved in multi-copper enzyme maturation permease subunit